VHQELICDATDSFSLAAPHRREPTWHNETFVLVCGDYTTLGCTRQAIAWWLFISTAEAGGFQATAPVSCQENHFHIRLREYIQGILEKRVNKYRKGTVPAMISGKQWPGHLDQTPGEALPH
jgi:hypothetical protein